MKHRPDLLTATSLLLVGLDQATKWWLLAHPGPFTVVLNAQGAFSLPLSNSAAAAASLIFLIGLLCWLFFAPQRSLLSVAVVTLLFSGGLANLVDRILRGGVVDVQVFGYTYINIADIYVSMGSGLLLWQFFGPQRITQSPPAETM